MGQAPRRYIWIFLSLSRVGGDAVLVPKGDNSSKHSRLRKTHEDDGLRLNAIIVRAHCRSRNVKRPGKTRGIWMRRTSDRIIT
jgi:hypothetical protein